MSYVYFFFDINFKTFMNKVNAYHEIERGIYEKKTANA